MLEKLFAEYEEYRTRDKHPLPWDIWLKHKKKVRIKNDYCSHGERREEKERASDADYMDKQNKA